MAVYTPLFVYLTPASIPQVVAHIQKYLEENPIVSDPEAIAEAIQKYIEEHPEIIAVTSVNGKTGNVVLTGSDININASSAVTLETQLLNLASMIQSMSGDITQIEEQLETIYTNIGTLETNVSNNTTAISALQASVEGQGTRLATAESDIDSLESAQSAQNTRLNTAEGNISSLQTRMTQAETDIDSNESSIGTIQTDISSLSTNLNSLSNSIENIKIKSGDVIELGRTTLNGFITGAGKTFEFGVPLGRNIEANGVTITSMRGLLRGVSGYIGGSTEIDFISSSFNTPNVIFSNKSSGLFVIQITSKSDLTGSTNNTPFSFLVYGMTISFT